MIRRQLICQELLLPVGNPLEIGIREQARQRSDHTRHSGDRRSFHAARHGLGVAAALTPNKLKHHYHAFYVAFITI
jgi:hypothetical protein